MATGTPELSEDPGKLKTFPDTFKGKLDEIQKKYNDFWSLPQAAGDVLAYYEGKPSHQFRPPKDTNADKWLQPSTNFSKTLKQEEILHGNDKDNATILRLFESFYAEQYGFKKGGMSAVHVLVIPKARYFNGVSLNRQTVGIIDEMIALFKKKWTEASFREKVIENQRKLVESADKQNNETTEKALNRLSGLEGEIRKLNADEDFLFGFHLYPGQTVSHLHLHVIAKAERLREESYLGHDRKTVDALELRDYIMSLPESHPANQVKYPAINWS